MELLEGTAQCLKENTLLLTHTHTHTRARARYTWCTFNTRWFKYDRDDLCVNKSQFVPVIFEPPCITGCVFTV